MLTDHAMFTRVPTFIPTALEQAEATELQSAKELRRNETTGETSSIMKAREQTSKRRKSRTKTLRKRLPTKLAKDAGVHATEKLPVICDSKRRPLPSPNCALESRNEQTAGNYVHSPISLSPYPRKERVETDLGINDGIMGQPRPADLPKETREHENGEIINMEVTLSSRADMLTHAILHKRNRRKFTTDNSDIQTKRQARRNELACLSDRETSTNTDGTAKSKSSTDRLERLEETGKFRSRIPVRFPEIQENKRYSKSKPKQERIKCTDDSLPPICNETRCRTADYGHVTQSIRDYQNILEKDFQRLGENLENTFKLLHKYIERSAQTQTNPNP